MPKEDDVGPTRHQIACGYKLTSKNMMRDLFGFVQGRRTEDTKAKAIYSCLPEQSCVFLSFSRYSMNNQTEYFVLHKRPVSG